MSIRKRKPRSTYTTPATPTAVSTHPTETVVVNGHKIVQWVGWANRRALG